MTLKERLDMLGINKSSDTPILVRNGNTDMFVSRRYLEGGWGEILESNVIFEDVDGTPMFVIEQQY